MHIFFSHEIGSSSSSFKFLSLNDPSCKFLKLAEKNVWSLPSQGIYGCLAIGLTGKTKKTWEFDPSANEANCQAIFQGDTRTLENRLRLLPLVIVDKYPTITWLNDRGGSILHIGGLCMTMEAPDDIGMPSIEYLWCMIWNS